MQTSTDRGEHWTAPVAAEAPSPTGLPTDRPEFAAVAISSDGHDAWPTYDAHLDPSGPSSSRPAVQGVVLHAGVLDGALYPFFPPALPAGRGAIGDTRGSSANSLTSGFMGDYSSIVAFNGGNAVAVYNAARNGAVCPAVNDFRQGLVDGRGVATPNPAADCPATFGNTDTFGGFFNPYD